MPTSKPQSSGFQIRTVKSKADRARPSVFMRLKTDEAFKGVALFEPDPELSDNPGYFEYYDHYDKQGNAYVPCAGDKCPFCAANDNPSTRALTVWYFPQAADVKDQIKVFTMNYSTINEIADEAEDEDGLLGKSVRIKRLSDKGDYRVKVMPDKALTKTALTRAMGQVEEKFPDGLLGLVERQLKIQMERLKALDALDDDDEEEETTTPAKAIKGKPAAAEAEEEETEEAEEETEEEETTPQALEEEELEILRVSRKNNSVTVEVNGEQVELIGEEDEIDVSDFKKGDSAIVSAEYDDEAETWMLTAISEVEVEEEEEEEEEAEEEEEETEDSAEEDEDEEEETSSEANGEITGGVYEIIKVMEKDEIFDLKDSDGSKVRMWVGDGVEPEYELMKRGVQVKLDATTDEENDWIITAIDVAKTTVAKKKP